MRADTVTCSEELLERRYEYLWCDKEQYRKPTKLSAPQYMARLMEWVEGQVNDEAIFPSAPGTPFPRHYTATVRKILSRLFRVFVQYVVFILYEYKLLIILVQPYFVRLRYSIGINLI